MVLPVPPELQRSAHQDRQDWIDSGVFAVDVLCATVGRPDLAGVTVLDVGCGTKVVKTILDGDLPVGRYVGVDVSDAVVDWLCSNVQDPRFEFHHFPARNDLYNPTGPLLSEFERLPVRREQFDLICLFSVFTHLAPDDFVAMLRLVRGHVEPDGLLVFSLFIDDPTPLARALEAALASDDPATVQRAEAAIAAAIGEDRRGYRDAIPDQPLMQARYTLEYALELIDGTGWDVVEVKPRERHIQHRMVCRPI